MFQLISNYRTALNTRNADDGATAVEYGLMVALIAVVIIFAVTALGGVLSSSFEATCDSLNTAAQANEECVEPAAQ